MAKTTVELQEGDFAVVWNSAKGWEFLVPKAYDDEDMPDEGIALMAVLMRLEIDPEFRQECLDWMRMQIKRAS